MNWKIISKKLSVLIIPCLMIMISFSASAQMKSASLGNAYIPSNATVGVYSDINFENGGSGMQPGIIATNRSSNPGYIAFVNASWTNANDFQHVDGYVQVLSDEAFTFPVGDMGFFRPISISGAKGTKAAFYLDNPNKLTNITARTSSGSTSDDSQLVSISSDEYWHITGKQSTQLTLSWDINSDIDGLTEGKLERLQIVGWNGSEWEIVPSQINDYVLDTRSSNAGFGNTESSLVAGSISTSNDIIPNQYKYITFGVAGDVSIEETIPYDSELIGAEKIEMTVFPNPTYNLDNLKVDYNLNNTKSDAFLVIYAANGQLVFKDQLTENATIYNVRYSERTDGLYQVGIITDTGSQIFKPVIISNR